MWNVAEGSGDFGAQRQAPFVAPPEAGVPAKKELKKVKEKDLQTTNQVVAPKTAQADGQPLEATMVGTNNNAAPKAKDFDPEALDQQLRDETMRNYEEAIKKNPPIAEPTEAEKRAQVMEELSNGTTTLPAQTTEASTVPVEAVKPTAQQVAEELEKNIVTQPARPAANSGFAVPTPEERKAWSEKQYTGNTVMSQALDDMAAQTTDPKEKALYTMMADRARQYEGWQEEENAYRRGQAAAAREMRDRTTAAAQRRDKREYEDQDPSWTDTLRKVPIIQNLIGVRRLNPETMEMEWHYPRNAAEGVGALLTSLPMIAHAAVTGDNRMQKEYRGMEQNQMFYPYRMDYADMEDYRRGAMVQPTPTWSDKMAAAMGETPFVGLKEKQRLMGIETTAEYIRNKYGDKMAEGYIKSQLGIKDPAGAMSIEEARQAVATATYLEDDPAASAEEKALSRVALINVLSNANLPEELRNEASRLLNKGRTQRLVETGIPEKPVSQETEKGIAKDIREAAFDNEGVTKEEVANLNKKYPAISQQTEDIIKKYFEILNDPSRGEDEARKFLEDAAEKSVLAGNADAGWWNDLLTRLENIGIGTGAGIGIGALFGGGGALPGGIIGFLVGALGPDVTASLLRSAGADDAARAVEKWTLPQTNAEMDPQVKQQYINFLDDIIKERQGTPTTPTASVTNNWAREQAAKNAAISADIQREIDDANKNTVNTSIY